jgi:hypothetical protein
MKIRAHIMIDSVVWDALKDHATSNGVSYSSIVETLVTDYISGFDPAIQERIKLADIEVGIFFEKIENILKNQLLNCPRKKNCQNDEIIVDKTESFKLEL